MHPFSFPVSLPLSAISTYRRVGRFCTAGLALLCAAAVVPASASSRVDNFQLLDHTGAAHELYYDTTAEAVVLVAHKSSCGAFQGAAKSLAALQDTFAPQGVKFLLLDSNQDAAGVIRRTRLAADAAALQLDMPVLDDDTQLIGESLGVVAAGDVLVVNPKDWSLAWRGNLQQGSKSLTAVLKAMVANTPLPAIAQTGAATGSDCAIEFAQRDADHAKISYSKEIAPILQDNCVTCHQPGGIGPWAMTSYTMVRGFAPMIREVLRTKRMPPWHADPHVGSWSNDAGLSVAEQQTLVHWVEAGAPRGEGEDPLAKNVQAAQDWPLGPPDMVVNIPEYAVPASGVVDYQFPWVENTLDHGVWVRAVTVKPGDRTVVHHVLAGTSEPGDEIKSGGDVFDNYLIGYAPGAESNVMPEGTGVYVPKGGHFLFQLHYTPTGKATVDRSQMALYFAKEKPANYLRHSVVMDPTIKIPAGDGAFEEAAYFEFYKDATLYQLAPHSHYRGRSSTFTLVKPDGTEELLLNVPKYDFNWQRGYEFEEPKQVPAGSRLVHRTVYDNSLLNPANPDAEREVPWGLQSWDEMLYGDFIFAWNDETSDTPFHDPERMDDTQFIGFMDKNLDGRVEKDELSPRMQKRMETAFRFGDADKDGALSVEEYITIKNRGKKSKQKRGGAESAGGGH